MRDILLLTMAPTSKAPIRFVFDTRKFISCLAYFASECKDLTKLKAAKLFYFLDKYHLLQYGRPVIGDNYVKMGLGPVPSMALDVLDEIEAFYKLKVKILDRSNIEIFDQYLTLTADARYPVYKAKRGPDLTLFSSSEVEALTNTVKHHGKYAASTLVDRTHKDATFTRTAMNSYIDYRLFFEGEKSKPEALQYLQSLEEDINFLSSLDSNA